MELRLSDHNTTTERARSSKQNFRSLCVWRSVYSALKYKCKESESRRNKKMQVLKQGY